jgi:spore coat protein CotH
MSTHKRINLICCVAVVIALLLTILVLNGSKLGLQEADSSMGYEDKIFDTSTVHTINIVMDDWDGFLETAKNEEYVSCDVVIDGETYKNVALRAKGNTSLTQVDSYGNNRYSLKIEFDHYDSSNTYYGLDKLALNNIIQDNTYMKDYLCYQMMSEFGVVSPLSSFVYITVNDEDWGLYLAVEGVEDSFLQRNYGSDYGNLYKPDSQSMGGGRGNGKDFNMEDIQDFIKGNDDDSDSSSDSKSAQTNNNVTVMQVSRQTTDQQTADQQQSWAKNTSKYNSERPNWAHTTGDTSGSSTNAPASQGSNNPPSNGQGGAPGGNRQSGAPDEPDTSDRPELPTEAQGDTQNDGNNEHGEPDTSDRPELPVEAQGGDDSGQGGGKDSSMGSDDVKLIYTDDDYDSYSNIFDNAKTNITDSDKNRLIASLKSLNNNEDIADVVDVDEVIRYFVVHNFVLNFDSYTGSIIHNYYLHEQDGQLSMIPWDYNLAFGGFQSAGGATNLVNYAIDSPVSGGTIDSRPMLAWIFANEEYTELYHQYFNDFIKQYFDSGYFTEMIDSVSAMIAPYVEKDPTKFCTYEEFLTGVDTLKEFCLLRAESVSGQLDGTIPSTTEEQRSKSSTLIQATNINVSDMGSQNNGGGKGGDSNSSDNSNEHGEPDTSDRPELPPEAQGGDSPDSNNNGEPPALPDNSANSSQSDGNVSSDIDNQNSNDENQDVNSVNNQGGQRPDDNGNGGHDRGNMPGDPGQFGQSEQNSTSTWMLLGITVAVLALGLAFALLYKRRK